MTKKLIKIFNAKSLSHLSIIFIVFGLTGSLSVLLSEPILNFLKLKQVISFTPVYVFFRILIVLIIYQSSLLAIGTLFGQFEYFREIQKKFLKRIRILK
jgi:hypothetical protein